ncbi:hypothetical protein HMPREF6745_0143 [Prevotella sp. oral taxon 472 str. F0295]|nr:hypothetical protein HMPREF6745_0143 [Prevotella sp. oral taxon 472 str. F0295]
MPCEFRIMNNRYVNCRYAVDGEIAISLIRKAYPKEALGLQVALFVNYLKGKTKKICQNDGNVKKYIYFCNKTKNP